MPFFLFFFTFISSFCANAICNDDALLKALAEMAGSSTQKIVKAEYKVGEKLPSNYTELKSIKTPQGTYEVKYLAHGAKGAVYDINTSSGTEQILKISKDSVSKSDLAQEIQQAEKLKSSAIPYARVVESGDGYIIKEKIKGASLNSINGQYNDDQLQQLAHIYKQSQIHKIPLDLKKENFILSNSGEITLIDYGATTASQTYQATGRSIELWRNMFSSNEQYQTFQRLANAP